MAADGSDPKSKAEKEILGFLQKNEEIPDSHQFASDVGIDHNEIESVIKSLSGFQFIESKDIKKDKWLLTEEGKTYAANGSPEFHVFMAVPADGIAHSELKKKVDAQIFKFGWPQAIKSNWVMIKDGRVSRNTQVDHAKDDVKVLLKKIEDGQVVDDKDVKILKKRDLIVLQTSKGYSLRKGPNYAPERKRLATDLTREHLLGDEWKNLYFKDYNLNAKQPIQSGYLHPLLEVRKAIQEIFIQMGFEEMPTNNFVESSFWNFDALFQPQQHPARDSHDTFFLKVPSTTRRLPEDYVEKVKQVHESGGYGSKGYRYNWKRGEADKNLLRTHTTAVSTRMLYLLARKPFSPKRYFSIDRVFRNEAVDRTHLAEFHQIEGLICDRKLTLGDLLGVLDDFFAQLGMGKLRFKPAYNPYTEPSMEIFSYHEGLEKWVEVGNSGMFRPEMLRTMGLPEDVSVIAWGLSLERPTMILYGIDNIRDLFGPKYRHRNRYQTIPLSTGTKQERPRSQAAVSCPRMP